MLLHALFSPPSHRSHIQADFDFIVVFCFVFLLLIAGMITFTEPHAESEMSGYKHRRQTRLLKAKDFPCWWDVSVCFLKRLQHLTQHTPRYHHTNTRTHTRTHTAPMQLIKTRCCDSDSRNPECRPKWNWERVLVNTVFDKEPLCLCTAGKRNTDSHIQIHKHMIPPTMFLTPTRQHVTAVNFSSPV